MNRMEHFEQMQNLELNDSLTAETNGTLAVRTHRSTQALIKTSESCRQITHLCFCLSLPALLHAEGSWIELPAATAEHLCRAPSWWSSPLPTTEKLPMATFKLVSDD